VEEATMNLLVGECIDDEGQRRVQLDQKLKALKCWDDDQKIRKEMFKIAGILTEFCCVCGTSMENWQCS